MHGVDGVNHEVPEAVKVEFGCGLGVAVGTGFTAEVGHGHSGGEFSVDFHVDRHLDGLHDGGVNQVGDGAGVVHGREFKALCVLVGLAEEGEQTQDKVGNGAAQSVDLGGDFVCCQCLVGQIQSDHGDRPFFVEDDVGGFGVDLDVEFGDCRPVTDVVAASHEDDFADAFDDARLFAHGHGDVGQGAGGNQGHFAGFVCHDGLDDEVDGVAGIEFDRFGQDDAVESGVTVAVGCCFDRADQGAYTPRGDRDAAHAVDVGQTQGVVGDLLQCLVAADGGDGQEVNIRIGVCQQHCYGVVVSGIAVKNNLSRHRRPYSHGVFPRLCNRLHTRQSTTHILHRSNPLSPKSPHPPRQSLLYSVRAHPKETSVTTADPHPVDETHDEEQPLSPSDDPTTSALEWHAPTLVRITDDTTIPTLLQQRVQRSARRPLIARKNSMGDTWATMNAVEFYEDVQATAAGLIALGLEPGESLAIMSRTRYEWTLLDYAAWTAGLIPVPIYETSSGEQIEFIIRDADIRMVITETVTQRELVQAACQRLGRETTPVFSLDTEAIQTIHDAGLTTPQSTVAMRTAQLTTSSIATIVYTSGTTGRPKGTVLTHGNFTELALNAHAWMPEVAMGKDSRLLLFLPLAHVFARFLQVFQLSGEGILAHTPDTKNLLPDLATFRPSYLLVVPRVLEKIYNSADAKAGIGGKQKIFRWAARVAVDYSRALETPEGSSRQLRLQHALASRLVYAKILELVGGNASFIISGGAPLSQHLAHFYTGLGLPVLEGYGLTETVGPLSVNTPRLSKIGTVGPALPPMSIKISDEGEVLIQGPSVFQGYHNDPEASAAAFTEDGWFRTGDLGSLDRDGYLRITGRAKDIIVTAGGKNVAPASLEDPLRGHPLISQVVVLGDQRPFISALITLDADMLPLWLKSHGLPPMSLTEAATNIEVLGALERAVERANAHVSRAESIRKIRVLTSDFTEANGLLTPSLKVKRRAVLERYAQVVEDMYASGGKEPTA